MRKILYINGHEVCWYNNGLTGTERVFHDGNLLSKKWAFLSSGHEFEVQEDGEKVNYQIQIGMSLLLMPAMRVLFNVNYNFPPTTIRVPVFVLFV
ncbi:MAG: hypothetical protein P9L92_16160 [Candidatus Electryonea clarkiae]|nr:hypothetical protein [Candidatus Electryonea clarkiae]MDP8287899.1 hypothetical protein [Candidatus Electryonea clarkiae]